VGNVDRIGEMPLLWQIQIHMEAVVADWPHIQSYPSAHVRYSLSTNIRSLFVARIKPSVLHNGTGYRHPIFTHHLDFHAPLFTEIWKLKEHVIDGPAVLNHQLGRLPPVENTWIVGLGKGQFPRLIDLAMSDTK